MKCPILGKLYATPVFYKITRYYAAQIMSEMKVLNTSKLLFICYSPEGASFHIAMFNDDLWSQMWEEPVLVYGGDDPKKTYTPLATTGWHARRYQTWHWQWSRIFSRISIELWMQHLAHMSIFYMCHLVTKCMGTHKIILWIHTASPSWAKYCINLRSASVNMIPCVVPEQPKSSFSW